MERHRDSDADDSKVDGQTEPGQECTFVGAVVTGIAGLDWEEKGTEQRSGEERGVVGGLPGLYDGGADWERSDERVVDV